MKSRTVILPVLAGAAATVMALAAAAQPARTGDRNPLDTNRDGTISQEEFVAAKLAQGERRFERLDRNNDGLVTSEDIADLPQPPDVDRQALRACVEETLGIDVPEPPLPGTRFEDADLDGDGAITLDEALTNAEVIAINRFVRLDKNADGLLQRGEVRNAMRRAATLRRTRRLCLEEQQDIAAVLGG